MTQVRIPDECHRFFRAEISKDEVRPGYRSRSGTFVKHAGSPEVAEAEFAALSRLATAGDLVPDPISIDGDRIEMQLVSGIRVNELYRLVATLPAAHDPMVRLMGRLQERLGRIQDMLSEPLWPTSVYPFDVKVVDTLAFLSRILDLPVLRPGELAELAELQDLWQGIARVPFLDSVVKNMIVVEPRLAIATGMPRHQRQSLATDILADDADYFDKVAIRDVDFSSVVHLTAVEDDWISLQLHESSQRYSQYLNIALPQPQDPRATALSLVVRYFRFGARKIAYRIMDPRGAHIRFALDNEAYYFKWLPKLLADIDPMFESDYPEIMRRFVMISDSCRDLSPLVEGPESRNRYWQESPLELERGRSGAT